MLRLRCPSQHHAPAVPHSWQRTCPGNTTRQAAQDSRRRVYVRTSQRRGRAHEVEGAVGRDERDGPIVLKARQPHALVELHVLQVDRLVLPAAPLRIKQHLRTRWACCRALAACMAGIMTMTTIGRGSTPRLLTPLCWHEILAQCC